MKKIQIFITGLILITGLIYMSSCEERLPQDYTPYNPTPVTATNISLNYPPAEYYPQLIVLASDTPTFKVDGVYTFRIDTVTTAGGGFILNNFNIDKETGVITYDNTKGTLMPGEYAVDVSVSNTNGLARVPQAFNFTVLAVPISISVDNPVVDAGALQEGTIATVSYTDNSGGEITSVEFSLDPAITGFSIDAITGEITKTVEAGAGQTHVLSVKLTTNLGSIVFSGVVTVNVGAPPTLEYLQQNGATPLNKVTLSPTSAYSTYQPILTGMNSDGGWEVVMADTVPQEVIDAVSIDAAGVISVAGNSSLPDGDYVVSIKVTNSSGISFDFGQQFVISVVTKWGEVLYADTEFDPANGIISYGSDAASASSFADGGGYAKGFHAAGAVFNSWIIAVVKISADWNGSELLVSFEERNGWGAKQDPVYAETVRTLQYSYDNATWMDIMAADDPDWPMAGSGTFNGIGNQSVGSVDVNNAMIYFKWHYDNSASATKTKSVWMIDELKFNYTVDFPIVEE